MGRMTSDSDPIEVNQNGARQSALDCRLDLLPPHATMAVAGVLKRGAEKYPDLEHGRPNWHGIPTDDHLNHALAHILRHLAGDRSEDHLPHAACRLLFACELEALDARARRTRPLGPPVAKNVQPGASHFGPIRTGAGEVLLGPNGPYGAPGMSIDAKEFLRP